MEKNIGGYYIGRTLGTGGMSTVYEATDEAGNRVAFKLIHPAVADSPGGRERLQREISTLQRLRGPAVAEVLDAEIDGPDAFIVTQLIDGPTLQQYIRENGPMDVQSAARLGRALYAAVESVHAQGVVHRDLKPSNIMLDDVGPVLIDFGIAQTHTDSRLTVTGAVTHTPGYLDPRVLHGGQPDEAADMWALSAIMAFVLSGHDPYRGATPVATIGLVMNGQVDLSGVPAHIARVLHAQLTLPLEERPPFAELLHAMESGVVDPTLPMYVEPATEIVHPEFLEQPELQPAGFLGFLMFCLAVSLMCWLEFLGVAIVSALAVVLALIGYMNRFAGRGRGVVSSIFRFPIAVVYSVLRVLINVVVGGLIATTSYILIHNNSGVLDIHQELLVPAVLFTGVLCLMAGSADVRRGNRVLWAKMAPGRGGRAVWVLVLLAVIAALWLLVFPAFGQGGSMDNMFGVEHVYEQLRDMLSRWV